MPERGWSRCCLVVTLWLLAGCGTEIIHDISETEANEVLAALQRQGIAGEKLRTSEGNRTSYTVRVGRGEALRAWQVLREENLPRPRQQGLGEVFGKPGLVPTATQERAMLHQAVAGELSRTLQSIEGILEARVHVVLPSRDPLAPADAPQPAPRASVLLRTSSPPPLRAEAVQRLVAGAIDGLRTEAVTVLLLQGQSRPTTAAAASLARVGPFLVATGSTTPLRLTLVAGLSLLLLLGVAVIVLVRRGRSLRRAARQQAAPTPTTRHDLESSLGLVSRSLAGRSLGRKDAL